MKCNRIGLPSHRAQRVSDLIFLSGKPLSFSFGMEVVSPVLDFRMSEFRQATVEERLKILPVSSLVF